MKRLSPQSVLAVLIALLVAAGQSSAAEPTLEHDVLPILTKKCMACHGGLIQKAKLDLRTLPAMLKGGETGPAVVKGKPGDSEMWLMIETGEMPSKGEKLTAEEKRTIRDWIAAGLPTFAEQKDKAKDPALPAGRKHDVAEVAATIDEHVNAKLAAAKIDPAPPADDIAFMRRVYLDLTGRVPTPQQATAFLDDTSQDKRTKLIDTLLASPQFGEQFGRTWRDWICPPELPSDMNGGKQPHTEARRLGGWFADRFNENATWDKIVRELLTVKGEIKDQPHVIFYGLVGQDAKITPDGSAREVASLFMGVQLQCAQCHDDPYRDWAQREFWSLAAFFGGTKGDFRKVEESPGESHITIPKSAFKNAGTNVPIAFLGDEPMTDKKKTEWRPIFADWLTRKDNPYFARAFANRVWFYLFARGLVNPVDDIRPLNPPTHPALLKLLENEFAASGFDVKHLIRCVCNSQAYQRTSRVDPSMAEADRVAQTDLFGRAPVRVMTADMLYDSLKLAYGDEKLDLRSIDPKDGNASGESAPIGDPWLQFQRDFCNNEEDATDFTHGVPQMLTLLNHPRLLQGSRAIDEYLKAKPEPTADQTIEWLYLSTLSRRPSGDELAEARAHVDQSEDQKKAYVDVLWMLVNRSEFMLIR